MQSIIEVFRMNELSIETREKIIRKLGFAINDQYGMNITEPLVIELILSLNPNSNIINEEHYKKFLTNAS